ncbi:MAG: hypothetical protein LBC68_13385 [Prevotellaceae bacterium]|jgi:hypothetical protein|nr:hypothetical protein [Prevotellaceae bacterium]
MKRTIALTSAQCEELKYGDELVVYLENHDCRYLSAALYEFALFPGDTVVFEHRCGDVFITEYTEDDEDGFTHFIKLEWMFRDAFYEKYPEYLEDEDGEEENIDNKVAEKRKHTVEGTQTTLEF